MPRPMHTAMSERRGRDMFSPDLAMRLCAEPDSQVAEIRKDRIVLMCSDQHPGRADRCDPGHLRAPFVPCAPARDVQELALTAPAAARNCTHSCAHSPGPARTDNDTCS